MEVSTKSILINATGYQEWVERAFLALEGALSVEMPSPSRIGMSEEYVRAAFTRGLMQARPGLATRVKKEKTVWWNDRYTRKKLAGKGRPIQHDIAIDGVTIDNVVKDAGLLCEVKWLTQSNATGVLADIFKLAFSRTTNAESIAPRTYLLVGGEQQPFRETISRLRNGYEIDLKWSPAGRGGKVPRPHTLCLEQSLELKRTRVIWRRLIARGKRIRKCPPTWSNMRASVRKRWMRTLSEREGFPGASWRLVLWELDHRGLSAKEKVDWPTIYDHLKND